MTKHPLVPQRGQTLFASLHGELPVVITVTGFREATQTEVERLDLVHPDGRVATVKLDSAKFYPEAPTDARYIYQVEADQLEYPAGESVRLLGYFFDAQSAIQHMEDVEAGRAAIDGKLFGPVEYSVRIVSAR